MNLEFTINIKPSVLYDYMLQHSYKQAITILATALGFTGIFLGITRHYWIYIVFGVLLVVYTPISLLRRAFTQAKMNPAFTAPLHYNLTDEGITISQGETNAQVMWDQCSKAVSTRMSIILYTSKRDAFIFPRAELKEQTTHLIEAISTHMPPERIKIKQ